MCTRRCKKIPQTNKAIGIDLGLKDFIATSDGETVANPKTLAKYEKKIVKLNRELAKKENGSNNWLQD